MEHIRQAIQRLQIQIGFMSIGDSPDAGIALRQGLRIGMWLAEVGAIIVNERTAKVTAAMGIPEHKGPSVFWKWVMEKSDFVNMTPRKVLRLLHGLPDPEFPRKKMLLKPDDKPDHLMRGDGATMTFKSFGETLSRHRRRLASDSFDE
jgi:hypothetical protein